MNIEQAIEEIQEKFPNLMYTYYAEDADYGPLLSVAVGKHSSKEVREFIDSLSIQESLDVEVLS